MPIKIFLAALLLVIASPPAAFADDMMHGHHGQQVFHAFRLELDHGGGKRGAVSRWDLNGWIGGDNHKLWLKSEGKHKKGSLEETEFWAMYSRNIATFWDFQIGARHDTKPRATSYAVLGFNGLAPYFLDTEAHIFVSDDGDVSARLKQGIHLLFTQRWGIEPYYEINAFAQNVPELGKGRGLSDGKIGLKTGYEITREFMPYVDFRYERKFGRTSAIASDAGNANQDAVVAIGVKFMF